MARLLTLPLLSACLSLALLCGSVRASDEERLIGWRAKHTAVVTTPSGGCCFAPVDNKVAERLALTSILLLSHAQGCSNERV